MSKTYKAKYIIAKGKVFFETENNLTETLLYIYHKNEEVRSVVEKALIKLNEGFEARSVEDIKEMGPHPNYILNPEMEHDSREHGSLDEALGCVRCNSPENKWKK
jgi:hypothetical protein